MRGSKLKRTQEQAIVALLTEKTQADAAAKVGVAESTLQRWLLRSDFQAAYREARGMLVESAVAKLQAGAGEAVDTLRSLLQCKSDSTKCRAAIALYELSVKAVEFQDLAQRVDELEKLADEWMRTHGAANQRPAGPAEVDPVESVAAEDGPEDSGEAATGA